MASLSWRAFSCAVEWAAMYEKFTDRSRGVMALGEDEAHLLSHDHLGTEHVLLGLIAEDGGVAANILKHLDFD